MRLHRAGGVAIVLAAAALATAVATTTASQRGLVGSNFPAHVAAVVDGDTIDVVRPGSTERMRVRLDGIDAPEAGEPYSQVARSRTRVLAFDRDVIVSGRDVDRYGRLVARVMVADDGAPRDLSIALVAEGLACHYLQYSSDPVLAAAETEARSAGRGFWAPNAPKPACVSRPAPSTPAASPSRPTTVAPRPMVGRGRGAAATDVIYHGNTRSRVFHAPTCRNYNCPNCTRVFRSREEATAAGFPPAGDCLKDDEQP